MNQEFVDAIRDLTRAIDQQTDSMDNLTEAVEGLRLSTNNLTYILETSTPDTPM